MMLFLKSSKGLSDLASRLQQLIESHPNPLFTGMKVEERDGQRGDGDYYLFETTRFEFHLIRNRGEVLHPKRRGWPYYISIDVNDADDEDVLEECVIGHLTRILAQAHIKYDILIPKRIIRPTPAPVERKPESLSSILKRALRFLRG